MPPNHPHTFVHTPKHVSIPHIDIIVLLLCFSRALCSYILVVKWHYQFFLGCAEVLIQGPRSFCTPPPPWLRCSPLLLQNAYIVFTQSMLCCLIYCLPLHFYIRMCIYWFRRAFVHIGSSNVRVNVVWYCQMLVLTILHASDWVSMPKSNAYDQFRQASNANQPDKASNATEATYIYTSRRLTDLLLNYGRHLFVLSHLIYIISLSLSRDRDREHAMCFE